MRLIYIFKSLCSKVTQTDSPVPLLGPFFDMPNLSPLLVPRNWYRTFSVFHLVPKPELDYFMTLTLIADSACDVLFKSTIEVTRKMSCCLLPYLFLNLFLSFQHPNRYLKALSIWKHVMIASRRSKRCIRSCWILLHYYCIGSRNRIINGMEFKFCD